MGLVVLPGKRLVDLAEQVFEGQQKVLVVLELWTSSLADHSSSGAVAD